MSTYHEFDKAAIDAAIQSAQSHYDHGALRSKGASGDLADDGHLSIAASCVAVTVEDGKICLSLPLNIGKVCIPIPKIIPNGTAAEACLHICTYWGIPTGVKVTISVLGKVIVKKTFGKC